MGLFKVGNKEGIVREVLETRGIVCHHVGWSWDVEGLVAVAVSALVEAGVVAKVRWGAIRGDSSLVGSRHGRGVVAGIVDGAVADIMLVGHEGDLSLDASLLQVAVGDVSFGVVEGDQASLHILWKREARSATRRARRGGRSGRLPCQA